MQKKQILLETPHYLAINKPTGFIVEKNPFERAMEDFVEDYLKKKKPKPFVGIIHRLDRVTSGVLLFAKKKTTLKYLNKQLELRKIRKTYLAIVTNPPAKSKAFLRHFLERDFKNKKAILHDTPKKRSSECRLRYRKIAEKEEQILLEIAPETGRFHQIRAQLSAIRLPHFRG